MAQKYTSNITIVCYKFPWNYVDLDKIMKQIQVKTHDDPASSPHTYGETSAVEQRVDKESKKNTQDLAHPPQDNDNFILLMYTVIRMECETKENIHCQRKALFTEPLK